MSELRIGAGRLYLAPAGVPAPPVVPEKVYIAPVGSTPGDTEAWRELDTVDGVAGLTVSMLVVDGEEARWARSVTLPGPATVSFTGTIHPGGRRLLLGLPPLPDPPRVHAAYRRRARARARRRRS